MIKITLIALVLIALPVLPIIGNQADSINDNKKHLYFKTQYAGNWGLASVGIGKEYGRIFSVDVNFGHLPEFINGARVNTFAVKPAFLITKFTLSGIQLSVHLGASLNYAITKNTFLRYPAYYPDGYYLPNALHLCPYIRATVSAPLKGKKIEKISVYSEIGTVEYEIYNAIRDREVKFYEIWNLCFGLAFHFSKEIR